LAVVFARSWDHSYDIPSSAAMFLVGLVLLFIARRGRRIDDHPLCRRCGFDLCGLPWEIDKCSECGASLTRRRAIRIGHRQNRYGWLFLALPLILASGSCLFVQTRRFIAQTDFTPYKPVWWLMADARGGNPSRRDLALNRLVDLWSGEQLDEKQNPQVVRLILAAQADSSRTWNPAWGQAFETAHTQEKISVEDWQTYWRQAWSLSLIVPDPFVEDDHLPVLIGINPKPKDSGQYVRAATELLSANIQGIPLRIPPPKILQIGHRGKIDISLAGVVARLEDGPQNLDAVVHVYLYDAAAIRYGPYPPIPPIKVPLHVVFTLQPPRQLSK
jgi:hypothetical protein